MDSRTTSLSRFSLLLGVLAVVLAFVLAPFDAAAQDRPSPLKFLKDTNKKVTELVDRDVKGDEKLKRDAELREIIGALIDYDDMAQRSLGKHWEPLTEEQRTEYRALFRRTVELTYIDKLGSRDKNVKYKIEWDSERTRDALGYGKAWVLYKDTETELDFTLKAHEASWLIHDLAIDGASLEETYQRNYGETIEKEGFDGLMKKMRDRVAELEAKK